jgi:hypothetical protein
MASAKAQEAAYFSFDAGSAHVFMTDSRSLRDTTTGVIIGETQLDEIKAWLLRQNASNPREFKIIASTPGVSHNEPDQTANWHCRCPDCTPMTELNKQRCPNELDRLLDFITQSQIQGVLFISGDTHKPGVFELAPGIIEFSASPIHGIGPSPFPTRPDRVLYDQTDLLEAFSVFEVEGSSLSIKIYGGGYRVVALTAAWVDVLLLVMWATALFILRKQPKQDRVPWLLRDNRFIAASLVVMVGVLMICGYYYFPVFVDPDFNQPRFKYEYRL